MAAGAGASPARADTTSDGRPAEAAAPTRSGPARDGPRGPQPAVGPGQATEVWLPQRDWVESAGRPAGAPPPGRHRRPRPPGPAVFLVPHALQGARLSGPRAAVLGMLLVVALAVVGFGVRVAWARADSVPRIVTPAGPGGTRAPSAEDRDGSSALASRTIPVTFGRSTSGAGAGAGGPPPSAAGVVTVHVVGQVKRPGVVKLSGGSRVADAVARAGGALPSADVAAVNLARPLVDGEQIRVPKPGERVAGPGPADPGASAGSGSGSASGPGTGSASGELLNLNTANPAQLEELPGVGPVLAQRIIDWRMEHGRFATVDELAEVSGIGEKMFAQLQPKVTV